MSTLRISDAPLLPDVDGTEKIPTGGRGDYAISVDQIKDHIFQDIGKELVGLGNVDNTSDLDKPVSTAQQAALNLKADKTYVDVNLDLKADKTNVYTRSETTLALSQKADLVGGVIPSNQLPSYVDDVVEYTTNTLPIVGESGKIYITTDTNRTWRWSGNQYVEISNGGISDSTLKLQTARKIANVDFDGTQNIDIPHNNLVNRDAAGAHPASAISDASGKDQQQINDFVGAPWYPKPEGYPVGARVTRIHGALVRSVVPNNTNNPNENMTGWVRHHNTVYADEYGILPNHAEEQTLLINAAAADAASKGLVLNFGPGTYTIDPLKIPVAYPWNSSYAIDIRDNMHIVGEGAIFKVKDGSSTLAAPKWYTMFFTDTYKKNWSIKGLIFDGNWENNRKGTAYSYNQAFIGVFGNTAYCDDVIIKGNVFKSNPGQNNIVLGVTKDVVVSTLGRNWDVSENWHIDCGTDSKDFTAVFGYANNVKCNNSWFLNSRFNEGIAAAGPRNAYEVHGSNQQFNNNFVKSYYSGMIVNSNWSEVCSNIQVNYNIMVDMYEGGIRLWRMAATPLNQTLIKDVQIKGNQIHLNGTKFGDTGTYKGGIWGTVAFALSMENVDIDGNTVTVDSYMRNVTAGVYLKPDVVATTEVMKNFNIRNNRFIGTYSGVHIQTVNGAASFDNLIVEDNEHIDGRNVLEYTSPTSYVFSSVGTSAIKKISYKRNKSINTRSGVTFAGNILDIDEEGNTYSGVSIMRSDTAVATAIRRGDASVKQEVYQTTQAVKGWNLLQRKGFKVNVDYTKFAANQFQTLFLIPAKARVVDIIADVVTPFAGWTTPTIRVGTANSGSQYLLTTDVSTSKQIGNTTTELGSLLTGGKNGQFANWNGFSEIVATLSSSAGGTLTAGSIDFYIVVEYL